MKFSKVWQCLAVIACGLSIQPAMAEDRSEFASYLIKGDKRSGKFEGPAEIWTSPKARQAVGSFRNGLANEAWTFSDSRGVKIAKIEYSDGKQTGTVQMWYGSFSPSAAVGKLKLAGVLKDGRWDGIVVTYSWDGSKRSERTFEAGVLIRSIGYDGEGRVLPENQAMALARRDTESDMKYLSALDTVIRESVAHAQRIH